MRYLKIYKWQQEAAWQAAVCFTCQVQTSWKFFFISEMPLLNKKSRLKVPSPALYLQTRSMSYQEGSGGGNRMVGIALISSRAWLTALTWRASQKNLIERTKDIGVHERLDLSWGDMVAIVPGSQLGEYHCPGIYKHKAYLFQETLPTISAHTYLSSLAILVLWIALFI